MSYVRVSAVAASAVAAVLCVGAPSAQEHNGISVDRAKLFDNRTLVVMLEQLGESLKTVQGISPSAVTAAVGQVQGSSVSDVQRSFQVTGFPTTAVDLTTKTTGGTDPTTETEEKRSTSSVDPRIPALSNTATSGEQKFGIAAQDLLTQQVDLTYQVFNLRMLLERAISDRLFKNQPRLQAVLGFDISIDPQKRFRDAAAVVEVTMRMTGATEPLSLVSLMPRQKTYNMAVLDRRANAFGGAIPVKVLTIGYAENRQHETYFLYQDSDTHAFHRQATNGSTGLTVGWQFRPVFDRRAVAAGPRQVFAVVSLPAHVGDKPAVTFDVRTYWTKFDGGKSGVTDHRPLKNAERYDSYHRELEHSDGLTESLAPTVGDVSWRRIGTDGVFVDVAGGNFYQGTAAIVDSKVVDSPAKGLITKSDQRIQLLSTLREIANSRPLLTGRYGKTTELVDGLFLRTPGTGLDIETLSWHSQPERQSTTLTIKLGSRCQRGSGRNLQAPDFKGKPLLVSVGDFVTDLVRDEGVTMEPVRPLDSECKPTALPAGTRTPQALMRVISVEVPTNILMTERSVKVQVPFATADFTDAEFVYPGFRIDKIIRISESPTVLDIVGAGFHEGVLIHADREYTIEKGLKLHGSTVIRMTTKASPLVTKQLVVKGPFGEPIAVAIPPVKPEPPEPAFSTTIATAKHESVTSVTFEGAHLSGVRSVTFEDKTLVARVSKDGKTLTVLLTREVTKAADTSVELLAKDASDEVLQALTVNVVPKK